MDLHNLIGVTPIFNTQAISSATTTTGNIVDLAGYEGAEIVLETGALANGTFQAVLQEGDAANLSDAATVAAADILGSTPSFTKAANEANSAKRFGYRGTKRYIRLNIVTSGTVSGTIGAVCIRAYPRHAPVA